MKDKYYSTMDAHIKTAREFNVENVSFGAMKVLDTGGRLVYISYDGSNPLIVQTPEMYAPYGISSFSNDGDAGSGGNGVPSKFTLDLAFKNVATKPSERCLLKKLKQFDERVISTTFDNAMSWLKKKFQSLEVIEALYTHSIKMYKDKDTGDVSDKYPPTFKMNVPHKDGKFLVETYDVDGNALDIASMIKDGSIKGASISAIMRCTGIWIAGGKFGCTWRAMQLRVKRGNALPPCAFAYDDDEFGVKVEDSDSDADDMPVDIPVKKEEEAEEEEEALPTGAVKMEEDTNSSSIKTEDVDGGGDDEPAAVAAAQAAATTTTPTKKRAAPIKKK